jgi:hypothetical protein
MKDNNPTKTYNTRKQIQKNIKYFNSSYNTYANFEDNFENPFEVKDPSTIPVVREGPKYLCAKEEIFQTVLQLGLRWVGDRLHDCPFFF